MHTPTRTPIFTQGVWVGLHPTSGPLVWDPVDNERDEEEEAEEDARLQRLPAHRRAIAQKRLEAERNQVHVWLMNTERTETFDADELRAVLRPTLAQVTPALREDTAQTYRDWQARRKEEKLLHEERMNEIKREDDEWLARLKAIHAGPRYDFRSEAPLMPLDVAVARWQHGEILHPLD